MAKYRSHQSGVFGVHLHVATTRKQWRALQDRFDALDDSPCPPDSVGLTKLYIDTANSNEPHFAVWLAAKTLDAPGLVETIAHEAVHVAALLLDHLGETSERHNSEVLAYLTGWAAARIWESIP